MNDVPDYSEQFASAIKDYWQVKASQKAASSSDGKSKDVRAGKHMDAFERLIHTVVADAGIELDPQPETKIYLPGYYRETKSWDVVMQYKGHVLAIVEAKSQGSSWRTTSTTESKKRSGKRPIFGRPMSGASSCRECDPGSGI